MSKDIRSSLSCNDVYRGISLSNAIGKLFAYVVSTSDMQFGFNNKNIDLKPISNVQKDTSSVDYKNMHLQ